jgi:hypothetical protein
MKKSLLLLIVSFLLISLPLAANAGRQDRERSQDDYGCSYQEGCGARGGCGR